MKQFVLLILLFVGSPSLIFSQNSTIKQSKILVSDLTKINQISNVKTSPDGKSAIYALKTTEPDADAKLEFKYRTHLWFTDFETTKQLTFGQENESNFNWSPDGKKIAFLRNVKGKSQIFILNLSGGEAMQLSDFQHSIGSAIWSPDGSKIMFTTSLKLNELLTDSLMNPSKSLPKWSLEKPGFANNAQLKIDKTVKPNPDGTLAEIRAYLAQDEIDKKAKVINRLNFQGEATTEPEIDFTQLLSVEVADGKKITPIITGFTSLQNPLWSISGKGIYYSGDLDASKHPDREQDSGIYYYDIDKKTAKLLIGKPGMQYFSAALSSEGNFLALKYNPSEGVNFGKLAIMKSDGSDFQPIEFDRNAGNLKWADDTKSVYFTAQSNGAQPLYKLNISSKKVEQLSDNESGIIDYDITEKKIVYHKTFIQNPSELYVADISFKNQKQISKHNDWVKSRSLSVPTKHNFTNEKGQIIEYWIVKPTNFEPNKKYPLLLNMHGGPTAMWGTGEASMWHEFQYMAAQGYGIVYANPRGSGGYGLDFQRGNYQDWGKGPASDVLKACDFAAKEAWVDTSKLVITGGSYAGYLTAWIVGHDNRFKAAFSQRGVYDLTTFMGEGNAWRLTPSYFGLPWKPKDFELIKSESPYSYVDKIQTPLLIKHGENDLRTGVIQSEMLYKSMKYMGKEVEYVRMPGGTHELSRTGNVRQRIDRMLRIFEFFERYVGQK
jgi:dipeptidyl aminopeptidase/acylaminoacyl peptidase